MIVTKTPWMRDNGFDGELPMGFVFPDEARPDTRSFVFKTLLSIGMVLALGGMALALDFKQPITDGNDKPMKICIEQAKPDAPCTREIDFTLGQVVRNALYSTFQDEQNLSGEEKFKRAELALKTNRDGEKFSVEDVALMKKLVAKAYGPLVMHQAWTALDPPK